LDHEHDAMLNGAGFKYDDIVAAARERRELH
jgi:hypothetical protein